MFHLINISSFRARSFGNEVVFVILHIGPLFAIRYMVFIYDMHIVQFGLRRLLVSPTYLPLGLSRLVTSL